MSLNSLYALCGETNGTGKKKYIYIFLQAHCLVAVINNLPRLSMHLASEAIIRGLCEEAFRKNITSFHIYN